MRCVNVIELLRLNRVAHLFVEQLNNNRKSPVLSTFSSPFHIGFCPVLHLNASAKFLRFFVGDLGGVLELLAVNV